MPAPLNNKFWSLRNKHGRNMIFNSPDTLWEAACEYFLWCDENPWYKYEALKSGELAGEIISIPKTRPYTIEGLCLYLGISRDTFYKYTNAFWEEDGEGYSDIIARIRDVIYTQKFEGAAVGAFNANLISRELGLVERKQIEQQQQQEPELTLEEIEAELTRLRQVTSNTH